MATEFITGRVGTSDNVKLLVDMTTVKYEDVAGFTRTTDNIWFEGLGLPTAHAGGQSYSS